MTLFKKLMMIIGLTAMMMPLGAAVPANAPLPSAQGSEEVWGDKPATSLPDFLQFPDDRSVTTDLSLPHRTKTEILMWTEQTVAGLMSFGHTNLYEHFEEIKPKFVESGWNDFMAYINKAGLQRYVQEKRYRLVTVVNGPTYVHREGAIGGVYRWEVRVPLLFSFYKTDAYGNITIDTEPEATADLELAAAVTRIPVEANAETGETMVALSAWRVQDGRKNRKQRMP